MTEIEIIKFVAPIVSFIVSLFILYRVLVHAQEKQIQLLKDELEYRHSYKDRLEEIKAFYDAEVEMLRGKLEANTEDNENLKVQLDAALGKQAEVSEALDNSKRRAERKEDLLAVAHRDYMRRIEELEREMAVLRGQLVDKSDKYLELCQGVKERFGVHSIIELTEPDIYEQLKLKAKKNRSNKYQL